MQGIGSKTRDLTVSNSCNWVETLICGIYSPVGTGCAVSAPKQPKEGTFKPGEVVNDWSAAPTSSNSVFDPHEVVIVNDILNRNIVESEHARKIVNLEVKLLVKVPRVIKEMEIMYHPRECDVSDLFIVASGSFIFSLTTDIAVDTRKPALLQISSRTMASNLVPECRSEGYSLFVNCDGLEGIVNICRKRRLALVFSQELLP